MIRRLFTLLTLAILGSLVAGCYGIVHDQVTFTLAPEYFTKLKFEQFRWANLGLPERAFVGQIGFLASWWVGAASALLLGTLACSFWPPAVAFRKAARGFGMIIAVAVAAGIAGGYLGRPGRPGIDLASWSDFAIAHDIKNLPAFVQVASIHNASYLGGAAGFLLAAALLAADSRRRKSSVNLAP